MKTFKILGLLLTYPKESLINHMNEMMDILNYEKIIPSNQLKLINKLTLIFCSTDLISLQESYVETFDRGRSHCLHLFEHIHGESRDRGQAMVNLEEMYRTKGLYIDNDRILELPDYLPLFLEYLSLCELIEARELLSDTINIIAVIAAKLKKNNNKYYVVFKTLEVLSKTKINPKIIEKSLATKEDKSLEALDKEWEEVEAFKTNSNINCDTCNSFSEKTKMFRENTKI